MFNINIAKKRCLILINDNLIQSTVETLLNKTGYIVDVVKTRKKALSVFLQYKHSLVFIDEESLPRYPYRLLQFYKAAHRTPGIIIFRKSEKDLSGYCLVNDGAIEIIDVPFTIEDIVVALKQTDSYMCAFSKSLFYKDFLILLGLAIPVMLLLTYLLAK